MSAVECCPRFSRRFVLRDNCVYNSDTIGGNAMRFLSVRDLRSKSADIWETLPGEREMVITSNGRPVAILASVNESNLEESLSAFRQARAVDAVASLQHRAITQGMDNISMLEIDAEIKAVRGKRAK